MNVEGPVSWSAVQAVATKVAGTDVFASSYLRPRANDDFHRLSAQAAERVEAATGLILAPGNRVKVVDRPEWVGVNVATFQRMLSPLTTTMQPGSGLGSKVTKSTSGAQVGLILGWMSRRVLGQYDMIYDPDHGEAQDFLYYVAPNIMALEKRFGFPPEQFRLWIAVHECTHRAQFTGVPWLPAHFRSLVEELLAEVQSTSERTQGAVTSIVESVRRKRDQSESFASEVSLPLWQTLTSPRQREALSKLQGMMALLEGHAEVTMAVAAGDDIPGAERFHRVIAARRTQANLVSKVLTKLIGMDAKMRQYAEGAAFVRAVQEAGGQELFDQVWAGPEHLPNAGEIAKPSTWIERHQDTNVEKVKAIGDADPIA